MRNFLSADPLQVGFTAVAEPVSPLPYSQSSASNSVELAPAPTFPLENTFLLHSLPGATKTIYLDFTGHTTRDTQWNIDYGVPNIQTPPWDVDQELSGAPDPVNFSDGELSLIQSIWERVSEDFRPFQVNVTTEDPGVDALRNTGPGDTSWGLRVLIGGSTNDWLTPSGGTSVRGIAYLNSFTWDTDTPAFLFADTTGADDAGVATTVSHETGHALGLAHDGQFRPFNNIGEDPPVIDRHYVEYYTGHGSGPTSWRPIMGTGLGKTLTQWSKGEYFNATHDEEGADPLQDDLAIITTDNGFGYRVDDHGGAIEESTALELDETDTLFSAEGIIERNTDVDYFSFDVFGLGEVVSFDIDPFAKGPNLDILATIYDSSGLALYRSNPLDDIQAGSQTSGASDGGWAELDAVGNVLRFISDITFLPGSYYISVEGAGRPITFIDPAVHPTPPDWDPDGEEMLPPDTSDWGYTKYGSLGYYSITGTRKSDLVVGVDFDVAGGVTPSGWTLFSGGATPGTVNNLTIESTTPPFSVGTITAVDGVVTLAGGAFPDWAANAVLVVAGARYNVASVDSATQLTLEDTTLDVVPGSSYQLRHGTPYDLTISTTGAALTTISSGTPTGLPAHSLPLTNLNGYLTATNGETLSFVWSDLDPGAVYQVYVFGHASSSVVNEVTVTGGQWGGEEAQTFEFTQTVDAGAVAVNGQDGPAGLQLSTLALYVIANPLGQITIDVTNGEGFAAGVAGMAIASTELGSISGQKWHDLNGNGGGEPDPGEPGLEGWMIYLDLDNNGELNRITTPEEAITVNAPLVPQPITDYNIVKNELTFTQPGNIADVNVTLDITHTYDSDLDIWLMHPDWLLDPRAPNDPLANPDVMTLLAMDRGGNGDHYTNTTFDDAAATSITSASPPFTGTFRPMQDLSRFNGTNAAGKWTLWIQDDGGGDSGTLNSWSIEITLQGSTTYLEPFEVTDSEGNYTFTDLKPGVYSVREYIQPEQSFEGWTQTWAPPKVLVTSQGDIQGVSFGNWIPAFIPGSISGQVWNDVDGNGVQDSGDNGLAGWIVYFDADNDGSRDVSTQSTVYTAANLPKPINDFVTVTSNVLIEDGGSIIDLDVTLDITHSFMADLEAFLTSPSGRTVELFSGVGGQFNDFVNITFDDAAERSIETIGQADWPYANSEWRPVDSLSQFFADEAGGLWTLTLRDTALADGGSLNAWSLSVTTGERFTTTDAEGFYSFPDMPAGSYIIREEVQPGWVQTVGPVDNTVVVVAGSTATADFGNQNAGPDPTGDYNRDTIVDAADYVVFRKFFPAPVPNPYDGPDGNGSGAVDEGDRAVWMQHFGELASGGGSIAASSNVASAFSVVDSASPDGGLDDVAVPASTGSSPVNVLLSGGVFQSGDTEQTATATGQPSSAAGANANDAAILALLDAHRDNPLADPDEAFSGFSNGTDYFAADDSDELCDANLVGIDALFELIGA